MWVKTITGIYAYEVNSLELAKEKLRLRSLRILNFNSYVPKNSGLCEFFNLTLKSAQTDLRKPPTPMKIQCKVFSIFIVWTILLLKYTIHFNYSINLWKQTERNKQWPQNLPQQTATHIILRRVSSKSNRSKELIFNLKIICRINLPSLKRYSNNSNF
jgi:hypothetical protein